MNKINLPIDNYKDAIVKAIKENDFLIVVGNTGCGKTTRIPQFLYNKFDQVIVTEPRILTAKTASHRVADEMELTVGKEIGYKTGYDKNFSKDSKILFCTDGLQLVRTITMADGRKENVLVIDEIHLWNINMESLVAWCKRMRNEWNTKVVIMSATMDAERLKRYLGNRTEIINVPGRLYPVAVEHRSAYMLIPTIMEYVEEGRDTLVFVPGKAMMEKVIDDLIEEGCDAVLLPLHGELEWEDQKKCYESYGKPKVIVATNIAQDGVTIPGISVVDTGRANVCNTESGVESVVEVEISKAACKQREGRAGRTEGGRYTLCSNYPYENRREYDVPDIQSSILDRIVLHLAAAGLDAEELEFYHQPDINEIKLAKRKLIALGAIDEDNNVTKLGTKMAKMPISVEYARMIIEAEKYGVTEEVMTIAAIVEMGGLLKKGKDSYVSYRDFTDEDHSDLLCELDVWNKLCEMKNINFKEVGVTKKQFNRIKTHIEKLRSAIDDQVEIKSKSDREAILKSCLVGFATNIFLECGYNDFVGEDEVRRVIDKKSCVSQSYWGNVECIVGTPKSFPCKDRWGGTYQMNLVTFATVINKSMIEELVPNKIRVEIANYYDEESDSVEVYTYKYYRNLELSCDLKYDYNHPEYATLKAAYEEKKRLEEERRARMSSYSYDYMDNGVDTRQRTVKIDGKEFHVDYYSNYPYDSKPRINIDNGTLFETEVKNVFLDDGSKVYLTNNNVLRNTTEMDDLRKAVEKAILEQLRYEKMSYYKSLNTNTLQNIVDNSGVLGKVQLTTNNGGFGDEPIYVYGALAMNKNAAYFEVMDDEEKAEKTTVETLQNLFMKEIENRYPIRCFSAQKGKKKKILTPQENEVKMDFDSLVRELLSNLTISNIMENLEFADEYFLEITTDIRAKKLTA